MRKFIVSFMTMALMMVAGVASADPSFGPGNSNGEGNNAPHEMEPNCQPPGQTDELPQCQ